MKLKNVKIFFLFRFLKSVYWLSSMSCTQRVLTDCLICVVLEGCSLVHWQYCAMKLKECSQILSIVVPEVCSLIVHAVLYLKKVNWSNIVTKCPLHPKQNFGFVWIFWCLFQFNLMRVQSHLTCSPPCENKYLSSCMEKFPKSHEATPIPSIRYLLRATNYIKMRSANCNHAIFGFCYVSLNLLNSVKFI